MRFYITGGQVSRLMFDNTFTTRQECKIQRQWKKARNMLSKRTVSCSLLAQSHYSVVDYKCRCIVEIFWYITTENTPCSQCSCWLTTTVSEYFTGIFNRWLVFNFRSMFSFFLTRYFDVWNLFWQDCWNFDDYDSGVFMQFHGLHPSVMVETNSMSTPVYASI